jgi:ubiquitin-activating enzyme E1
MKVTLNGIEDLLVAGKCTNFDQCIQWARSLFEQYYHNNIAQLLYNFPLDAKGIMLCVAAD